MSYIGNSPGVASQRVTTTLTATAAQTQFTTQSGYVLGYVDVYLNGAKLVNGADFEAITGTYITLFAGAAAGDVVELISYVPRGLTDGYTKAEADSKFLDVGGDTATGNLAFATVSLSGNLTLNGGTVNGVGYLNGSKVVVAGSALTFDGTVLAAPTLNLTNALGIASGGTGQTTANAALNALLPTQTGNATKYLQTDGTNTTWDAISISTADITGTLPLANGGTGATTAAGALTSLGAYAASNPSGYTTNSGTVTSVGGTGTVNGLTLTGTVSTTGNLTLGGTLDLSAYSAAGAFSTLSASGAVTLSGGGIFLPYDQAVYFKNSTNTTRQILAYADNTYLDGRDGAIIFRTGVTPAEGFRLTSSSLYTATGINVGIGTSSTTGARLTVSTPNDLVFVATSSTTGNTNFRVSNTAAGGSNFDFASGSTGHYLFGYGTIPLVFGTNGITRATISSDGNFFISSATTNTNSSKLVVGGTISQTVGSTQYLVVDQSDVGTAPNQIPLNQHLGSLAFQDRENINFLGGTGALSSLDIAAISTQLNVSATDVFVYDTSKDSDGGAWRKRCQHTSWYNEQLNTATRGSRREFPAVAVLVTASGSLTIYDGDAPDLPMWMVFSAGFTQGSPAYGMMYGSSGAGVSAANSLIGVAGGYIRFFSFVQDFAWLYDTPAKYSFANQNLLNRNAYSVSGSTPIIVSGGIGSATTYDIAMTILPNAPIDPATDLPTPTIAIATSVGVSVIRDNGTISNLTWSGAALKLSGFNSDNAFCAIYNNGNTIYNVKYKPPYNTQDTSENYYYNLAVAQGPSFPWNPTNEKPLWGRKNEYVIGTTGVLRYLGEGNDGVPATRIYNVQTSTYNSGYMVGNIKGAWLSDTVQETVVGTELITNRTFDSSTAGWTPVSSTLSVVSGALRITNNAGAGTINGRAQFLPGFATIPGKSYVFTVTGVNRTAGNYYAEVRSGVESSDTWTSGSMQRTFVAVQTTTYVELYAIGGAGVYAEYDNVSVREADPDRSTNLKALSFYGTINKTPVAAGADLVAYSGFNGSTSYLEQPYNSALDFGTGDFSFMCWVDVLNMSGSQCVFIRSNTSNSSQALGLYLENGTWAIFVGSGSNTSIPINYGLNFITVKRLNGIVSFYVDGVLRTGVFPSASNTNFTDSAAVLRVGCYFIPDVLSMHPDNKVSLLRISNTAPTDAQILKIYNDEKYLFQENAKATLYGTSNAITALAYDSDTQLLHVGTSSGRSVFDGLRRVDNTTTAVATAISAVDGLVVEN